MAGKIIDETGNRYGRLVVLEYAGIHKCKAMWRCQCDCGNKKVIFGIYLRNGHTRSCGCLKADLSRERGRARILYNFNESLYDKWTPENVWLVGLLWADGNINRQNRISVCSTDKQLIQEAANIFGLAYQWIRQTPGDQKGWKDKYTIGMSSEKLANSLKQIGMVPAKSRVIKYPKGLPDEYFGHFLRGVFDGDGCLSFGKTNAHQSLGRCHMFITSGSYVFVQELAQKLGKCGIGSSIRVQPPRKKNWHTMWYLEIHKIRDKINLCRLMYPSWDVPCLHRKRDLFQYLMDLYREYGDGNTSWTEEEKDILRSVINKRLTKEQKENLGLKRTVMAIKKQLYLMRKENHVGSS